jgi:iron-only hydrogenase group A
MQIEVNNKIIEARRGDTIIEALFRNGIKVPTLCSMKGLSPTGACRICVVEVEGFQNLVTSCSYPVQDGMKIKTHSPRVQKARKILVELLLSNHPDDCLYCERNGTCELQDLSIELNIRERRITAKKAKHKLDLSSPSIVRDPAKCILCGRCVRVCDEIQNVSTFEFINRGKKTLVATSMNRDLNSSSCIACGQCVMACPTGALIEHSSILAIQDVLNMNDKKKIIQIGPAVSVSLAEEFGLKSGKDINGILVAVLRKIGFDYVFDTSFGADLVIMESAQELKKRIETGENLPLFSSCCPAWVKFVEQFYPNSIPNLSTCKSPQQMMGSIFKTFFASTIGVNPGDIISVAAMPCLAKKLEAHRPEMTNRGFSDVDLVLSTRELANLIRLYGIDVNSIEPQLPDSPFGIRSSAGKLFATSGGTSEGILRTLYFQMTGKELTNPKLSEFRGTNNSKEINLKIGKQIINIIVANGLSDIHRIMDSIANGEAKPHYVEVMACPGGCVNGGGQPFSDNSKEVKTRTKAIYDIDDSETLKLAHRNPMITELYQKFLENPNSEKAIKLLHVKYIKRDLLF